MTPAFARARSAASLLRPKVADGGFHGRAQPLREVREDPEPRTAFECAIVKLMQHLAAAVEATFLVEQPHRVHMDVILLDAVGQHVVHDGV